MYEPIENYGIIGDLHTVALVSLTGSIDFMCFPRFDTPTIFAALLDDEKGGFFSIQPVLKDVKCKQLYLPDTAILVTRFFSEEGIAEVTDFMPVNDKESNCAIIRHITTVRGKIKYKIHCAPRFDYARATHTIEATQRGILFTANDEAKTQLLLRSQYPLSVEGDDVTGLITLEENQSACLMLQSVSFEEDINGSLTKYTQACYERTFKYWKDWITKSLYKGRWHEMVHRSIITLKLMTSHRFGSAVAAPTFGLPEVKGGERNWDYRYTWIRDAAFTMYAFLQLGFYDEAVHFIDWVKQRCLDGRLQLLYAIDGSKELNEIKLTNLEGYEGASPVRIGNKAHEQFQLDIYGELIDTIYLYNTHGSGITYDFWKKIEEQIHFIEENWKQPDHGIWEIRSEKKEFLHSKMMCWVALDRAIKIADDRSFPYPETKWHQLRSEIYKDIFENFWNEEVGAFVQFRNSSTLDASVLLMPLMRIVSPDEPKWQKTMNAVEQKLKSDVLIYRYLNNENNIDGIEGIEGTFTMCSFWYVECLAKAGETDKAMEHFEKLLGYANHLGLFSEQLGRKGEHLGNFPQAFTHLALISAALQLDKNLGTM